MRIFVLGNPLLEEDSLPVKLLPELRREFPKIEFREIDPNEGFPEGDIVIIDTIINARDVVVIKDIDALEESPNYSAHDFDLAFALKLMKKMGKIGRVTIIGVPPKGRKILASLKKIIPSALSESGRRS
ncbi:MAG TPA: hypothetical protein VJI46_06215 [Candidatus Nanoarchaeia archaeon]|nr:hypothetical protein [Candidatus Nanoarchaeia archaeon]